MLTQAEQLALKPLKEKLDQMIDGKIPIDQELVELYRELVQKNRQV